jgi:hypothetical protein
VPGTDPRYDIPSVFPDNGQDGFDVLWCFRPNDCYNAGGWNQNIFGLILP